VVGGVTEAEEDAAGCSAEGEQANRRPDIAANMHSRDKAMGLDTSRN
jgi:hypothetical protein